MKKKIIALAGAVVLTFGGISAFAQSRMMVDVTASSTKLIALREDGTVKAFGYNLFDNSTVNALTGVKQIACEDNVENTFFVLYEDGTVQEISKFARAEFNAVSSWTDITYIDGANGVVVGLCEDGTLRICGSNASAFKTALSWTDIVSINAQEDTLTAVTSEGKVKLVTIYQNDNKPASWTNMKKVAYDTQYFWGLTNDGEIISTDPKYKIDAIKGKELLSDIADISVMPGYAAESGFYSKLLVLKCDGTLIDLTNTETKFGDYTAKVLYGDVSYMVTGNTNYAAVLKSGEIVSDRLSLTSSEWILGIDIRVGGKYVDCDTAPYIKNDRTMVPIRAISEALGARVDYDDETKTAIISKEDKVIKITMDSGTAYVNDTAIALEAPAENVNSRIFVPVRFVSEGLGCNVKWAQDTKSVIIE